MAVTQSLSVTEVAGSVNIAANTSKVRILWTSTQSGESWNGYTRTAKYYVSINGGDYTEYSVSYTLPQNATATIVDTTITVTHKSNGSGSVHVKTWMDTGISVGVVEKAYYCSLTTIARAATITSASSTTLGSECSIHCVTNSTSVTNLWYKFKFSLGNWSYTTPISKITAAAGFTYTGYTIPLDVAKQFPNDSSGRMTVTLYTYESQSSTTAIGDASSKNFTVTLPDNDDTQPTATMAVTPVSSLASPFNSLYIRGKTKVKGSFTNASGKYGASIVSYELNVDGVSYGDPYTSNYLITTGSVTVKGTITDSRGFSRTYTQTITVLSYDAPTILPASGESKIICARCDASGNLSDSGTYLKIKAKRNYSPVISSGVQKNFCSIRYRYKVDGGTWSDWVTILDGSAASDEISTGALLGGALDATKSYSIRVGVVDTLGESGYTSIPVPTDKVYMHRAGSINAFALGKYAEEENSFDVAQDMTAIFRGDVRFMGEAWISRTLGTAVSESDTPSGRWGGTGVYYRVCAGGKHVYVAFNVRFTTGATVRAESETIPYPPTYDVYALCPVGFSDGSRGIATVSVSPRGRVNIYAVHKLPGATLSSGETVEWIDGYIDYWT